MTVVEAAWGALGVLAASTFGMFGMFFYLASKVDRLGAEIGKMKTEMAGLSTRLDVHIERHAG